MARAVVRWLLAVFYAVAGALHLADPAPFVKICPPWVSAPDVVVALTGMAELLGAAGLMQPLSQKLRQSAGVGLALYALIVWPANFHHMELDLARPDAGLGLAYHMPRLILQPVIIWLALWVGEVTDWPFARPQR